MSNKKISKTMSYLLRHEPEGMQVDDEGWVPVEQLTERLETRDFRVSRDQLRTIVERDPKGRYELDGERIRARYGHSMEHVDPTLTPANVSELYHGTAPGAADRILEEGLKKQGRQKVHLSTSVDEALNVGRRHASDPVVLLVDVEKARQSGVRIERASSVVYVADEIPPVFLSRMT